MSASFETECLPYRAELLKFAKRLYAGRHADAEDLVQQTMMNAMTGWSSFKSWLAVRPWLYGICMNAFLTDRHRNERRARIMVDYADVLSAACGDNESARLSPDTRNALGALGEIDRSIVLSAYVLGLKYREIAAEHNLPIGTVMSRLFRARRALRPML